MKTEKYIAQKKRLPETGKQIIGSFDDSTIIVYQAFNHHIAEYAVKNQIFGGPHYSFNRMSWIKPGFLWMMHRSGWAGKEQQQQILAITLPIIHFKAILKQATVSSYNATLFTSHDEWRKEIDRTEVRLQWDPDHDPYGNQEQRKAIQIGMKWDILRQFCTEWITGIEDITGFVKNEHEKVLKHANDDLNIPYEEVMELNDTIIEKRIGITRIE